MKANCEKCPAFTNRCEIIAGIDALNSITLSKSRPGNSFDTDRDIGFVSESIAEGMIDMSRIALNSLSLGCPASVKLSHPISVGFSGVSIQSRLEQAGIAAELPRVQRVEISSPETPSPIVSPVSKRHDGKPEYNFKPTTVRDIVSPTNSPGPKFI